MRKHNGTQLYGIKRLAATLKMGMNFKAEACHELCFKGRQAYKNRK